MERYKLSEEGKQVWNRVRQSAVAGVPIKRGQFGIAENYDGTYRAQKRTHLREAGCCGISAALIGQKPVMRPVIGQRGAIRRYKADCIVSDFCKYYKVNLWYAKNFARGFDAAELEAHERVDQGIKDGFEIALRLEKMGYLTPRGTQ